MNRPGTTDSGHHLEPLAALRTLFAGDCAGPAPVELTAPATRAAVLAYASALDGRPMLYSALKRRGWLSFFDEDQVAGLRADHAATAAHNMALLNEAQLVVGTLRAAGADVALLKGMAIFAAGGHRDLGARQTLDIDILTRRSQRPLVERLLGERGYKQTGLTGAPKHLPAFTRDRFVVEVHEMAYWRQSDRTPVTFDELASTDRSARVAHTTVHLVHHLFLGSVFAPELILKTLWDLNEARQHINEDRSILTSVRRAAEGAGLALELGALTHALSLILQTPPPAAWVAGADFASGATLIDQCTPLDSARLRGLQLRYHVGLLRHAPLPVLRSLFAELILPQRGAMQQIYGLPAESPWMWAALAIRPLHLLVRAGQGAVALARGHLPRSERRS